MKPKDITILVIATIVIIISALFGYKLLNPQSNTKKTTTEADKIKAIPNEFDEKTYERIKVLSDYGKPALDNIGKSDLFAGY